MKKRIFAVAFALLLSVGILAGLHKVSVNPTVKVADGVIINIGDPPNW